MAKIPTAEQLGMRPAPQPSGNISRLNLETPQLNHTALALSELGASATKVGETLNQIALNEKKKIGAIRTADGVNQYSAGTLDLEFSEKDGFSHIQGSAVTERPLMEEYRKRREDMAKKIRDSLPDDESRFNFDQHIAVIDRQFDARLYRHISEKTREYQGVVFEGTLETENNMAAQLWREPGQIELSQLRIVKAIEEKAARDGLNIDNPKDRDTIRQIQKIAISRMYAGVMNSMLMDGDDRAAEKFFKDVRKVLTTDTLISMGNKVESASVDGQAMRSTDEVWGLLGPKSIHDPVRLDVMEQWLRDQHKDNPRVARASIQELRSRVTAHNDAEREMTASNKSKVLGAFHDGATLKQLQAMPEYRSLDGQEQSQIKDYVVQRGWSEQSHARQEAEYQDGEKARIGFARYWELSNPARLSGMSEAQIMALEPELGRRLTGDLMEMKRRMSGTAEVKAATIDNELFNTIAADAGLDPYNAKSSEKKEQLGRLRNNVEAVIDQAQKQKGGLLTREEKEKLMRNILQPKVMVDEWGRDPRIPAAAVPMKDRSSIYVPIAEIEANWMKGAINYMRSTGAAPMAWTDTKIKTEYRDRLEKAYALSITNGTAEEGRKILEGK